MRKRTRWIILPISSAIVLALIGWLLLSLALPAIVRQQVATILQRLGFADATFELKHASLWSSSIATIASAPGQSQQLKVGEISVSYSPFAAVFNGEIDAVRIREGRLVLSLDHLPKLNSDGSSESGKPQPLPVRSIELESCGLLIQRGAKSIEVPLSGTLLRIPSGPSQLNLRALFGDAPLDVRGQIDLPNDKADISVDLSTGDIGQIVDLMPADQRTWIASAGGHVSLRAEYHRGPTSQPSTARMWIRDAFVTGKGSFDGEAKGVNFNLTFDSLQPPRTAPNQSVSIQDFKISGQELKDVGVQFQVKSASEIDVTAAGMTWAGGRIAADPFVVKLPLENIDLTLSAGHVQLEDVLALLTKGRATGTGRISGRIPIKLTRGLSHVTLGEGFLASEEPGRLGLGEAASTFGGLLDQSDPRFTRDQQMNQVKQQVLGALVDFDYDVLRADFKPEPSADEVLVALRIQGKGRAGIKQPLDITLNLRGLEHGLNSYLSGWSRVFKD